MSPMEIFLMKLMSMMSFFIVEFSLDENLKNKKLIKDSLKLLYKQLSKKVIDGFVKNLPTKSIVPVREIDVPMFAQRLAGEIVSHLGLPRGCVVVNFSNIKNPGRVELSSDGFYFVQVHSRYRTNPTDIGAILAHEITHIFLHHHGIFFSDTFENEILTDTACAYFGIGWPCLNAYRVTEDGHSRTVESLGYLSPAEFGYVLGKRSLALGQVLSGYIKGTAAKQAFRKGYWAACRDHQSPPLLETTLWRRGWYLLSRYFLKRSNKQPERSKEKNFSGYQFGFKNGMRVIFECPFCSQSLSLPTQKKVIATCSNCQSSLQCNT